MTGNTKTVAASIAVAILVPAIWLAPAALVAWFMKDQVDFWYANYQFNKDKYDYYFEGANSRGLLDTCPVVDGLPSVRFKEDCK
jgi:hypothetical protein